MQNSKQQRHASWWRLGGTRPRLAPTALAELAKIKAILAGGGNGKH